MLAMPLLLTLVAAPALMFPGPWTVAGCLLIALGWVFYWKRGGKGPAMSLALVPIALLCAMALVGTAVSAEPAISASKLWGILLGAATYVAASTACDDPRWRKAMALSLAAIGTLVALAALVGADWSYPRVFSAPWLEQLYESLPALISGVPGSGVPRESDLFNPREVGGSLSLL